VSRLTQVLPTSVHPSWKVLVLIYPKTDITVTDGTGKHHLVARAVRYRPGTITWLRRRDGYLAIPPEGHGGFTHDYYSGTVAEAARPTVCLGIRSWAWAHGGPVSMPARTLAMSVRGIQATLADSRTAGALSASDAQRLGTVLTTAAPPMQLGGTAAGGKVAAFPKP